MAKTKIETLRNGIENFLMSSEVTSVVDKYGNKAAQMAGTGYESKLVVGVDRRGETRMKALVYPATKDARRDNFQNNTLEKVWRSMRNG